MAMAGDGWDIPNALESCSIYQWLQDGSFWEEKDFIRDILPQIQVEFRQELEHLKTATADGTQVDHDNKDTLAMHLYARRDGERDRHNQKNTDNENQRDPAIFYYEINRTLTALRALRWIRNNDAQTFNSDLARAGPIDPAKGLNMTPFEWLRSKFITREANVFEPQHAHICYALITSIIINDLAKDRMIHEKYYLRTGERLVGGNHDAWLKACVGAGMVPCLMRLPHRLQEAIMLGLEVAAESNFGQTAQAENVPAALYPLQRFKPNPLAWRLRFMEQILDLAGARGHINNKTALIFGAVLAHGNRSSCDAAEKVMSGKPPLDVYNEVLLEKYTYLKSQCDYRTVLDIAKARDRALMRILTLAGCQNNDTAYLCEEVLFRHPNAKSFRDEFINALNENGLLKPVIQLTYLPALVSAVTQGDWSTLEQQRICLAAVFQYANKCLRISDDERAHWEPDCTVMSRDIFETVQWIKSPETRSKFATCPAVLMTRPVPEAKFANKREDGRSEDYGPVQFESRTASRQSDTSTSDSEISKNDDNLNKVTGQGRVSSTSKCCAIM